MRRSKILWWNIPPGRQEGELPVAYREYDPVL